MERKSKMDAFGASSLVVLAMVLALNQVVIKVTNDGFQPVFFAGLRSFGAAILVATWVRFSGRKVEFKPGTHRAAILLGAFFSIEFLLLFLALDHTSVVRVSIILYSMPVWLAIAAHFFLPGETIDRRKAFGLLLAFAGVVLAIGNRTGQRGGDAGLIGDLMALGAAFSWAGIALVAKGTTAAKLSPHTQLIWQLAISALVLLLLSPLFGPLIRDVQPIHLWGAAFQIVIVASIGFLFWLWTLTVYPASSVASFSFLSPIFGFILGWLMLGESVNITLVGAAAMVAFGLLLINRSGRRT